jgi:signal peptidase I
MPDPPQPARSARWLRELAIVVVVALAAALLLRAFVVQTFFIPSGSMEPTLKIGDRILVNKLSYHLHAVGRGDIVVFARPADENCGGSPVADLVKRVIGLPGETISLQTQGSKSYVVINGKRLDESWLPPSTLGTTFPGPTGPPYNLAQPYTIPANHYFMMGDNRTASCDSRYWGPIPRSLIVGKVELRVWPISAFHIF